MRTGAELKVGLITVLAVALLFVYFVHVRGYRGAANTYTVYVTFDDARGLQRGDPVRMVGVKIGEVRAVEITPSLRARATLAVQRQYELYTHYTFQIAVAGIIAERFIEVVPQPFEGEARLLKDRGQIEGITTPGMAELVAAGSRVLENLNRTSSRLESVLSDQEILDGIRRALTSFSDAADATTELAESPATIAQESRPQMVGALTTLNTAAADLQAATSELRSRVTEGSTLDDFEETARQARETAENANRLLAGLADVLCDPESQEQLRGTIAALHAATQSMQQVGDDLQVFSGELRAAAPTVPRIAREADNIVATSTTIRERLRPPEVNAAFDVLYSGEADRVISSGRLDFSTSEGRFLRVGSDDIGEESSVNIQGADRQSLGLLRYGLVRSRLGFGIDVPLPRESTLSVDIFDPNDLRGDILADVPFVLGRSEWGLLAGMRDVGANNLFVAGVRMRR